MHWIDPDHRPEMSGLVDCFLVNGEGQASGPVLAVVRQGAAVCARGVRPRGVTMLAAVSVAPDDGDWIDDAGPPEHDEVRKAHRKQAHPARFAMEGRIDNDQIEVADQGYEPPARRADGSDADRIGAWPEKGIFDAQPGPNRNGLTW